MTNLLAFYPLGRADLRVSGTVAVDRPHLATGRGNRGPTEAAERRGGVVRISWLWPPSKSHFWLAPASENLIVPQESDRATGLKVSSPYL